MKENNAANIEGTGYQSLSFSHNVFKVVETQGCTWKKSMIVQ